MAVNEARAFRAAEREAAKKVREAELAAQATRAAEFAAQARREAQQAEVLAKAEAAERGAALAAEQKAERDARYVQHARPQKRSGGAGTSGFRSITATQCPLWVISGHLQCNGRTSLVSFAGAGALLAFLLVCLAGR
jgi:GTP cyclohydrolase FolE2